MIIYNLFILLKICYNFDMKKNKDKKQEYGFKLLFEYLKKDKLKLFLYVLICFVVYSPDFFAAIFIGKGLEALILKDLNNFILYLVLYEGLYIIAYCLLQFPKDYIYNYLEIKFMRNVSKDIYNKYQNLPAIAFEEAGVGELINRLSSDPERILDLLTRLVRLVCKSLVIIVVIIVSFAVSIYIGLEILLFAFIMGILAYKFFPIIKNTQKEIKKESDDFVKSATENITGIREIKSLGIKKNMRNIVFGKIDSLANNSMKMRNYEMIYYNINSAIYFTLQFIILLTCGYLFVKGHIAYSIFMMIESYIWRIDEVVSSLSEFGVNYNKVKVSLNRIDEVVNNRRYQDEKFGKINLKSKGNITFDHVSFKYRDDEALTLNNLNIVFKPNRKIAIVGKSGNGKTTIFNLLLRYFDPVKGSIKIDDVNLNDLSEKALRQNVSIIRQNPFLFNMSIIDNFRIVVPNVSLKKIREVCKKAYIDDYIMSLPDKYNTMLGEGGINLSGGQKQRLAIARTLLLNTKIILFDEATSALDNESQSYIKRTIDKLVKDHTIIIVAHRLSTIIDADEIHLINKGRLMASGTHQELLKNSKLYQSLYKNEDLKVE